MHVIGTAGHVDHGKSTLVAALTGVNPDRLKEEQEREMTIDLGFAWLTLPGGEQVGIVDVPGHRDFIENMLAGVGGIDAVLFVVAADEGIMPQTREHLAILDLLQVETGIVVLTKIDLAPDPEWLEMIEGDVLSAVNGTVLSNAPMVRVSAKTGTGLESLLNELTACLAAQPERADQGRARMPVDRVFTMPGFGTVVTGTLLDGSLKLGEDVEILPSGLRGRVRGLQSHKRKEQSASPGSRTAVNVSGVDVGSIRRGDVLAKPGAYHPTRRIDVQLRLLPDASAPLRHSGEVKFFLGTAEVLARARLLGVEELRPGEEGWLQLELREPALTVRGDRFILRRPSPAETIGGGVIVNPHPEGRHRRFSVEVLSGLESLLYGTPGDVLLQAFGAGALEIREAVRRARLDEQSAQDALIPLIETGRLILLEEGESSANNDRLAISSDGWRLVTEGAVRELEQYHRQRPLRRGMGKEELKSRLKISPPRVFNLYLRRWIGDGILEEAGNLVWLRGHIVRFTTVQQAQVRRLLDRFAAMPFMPPSVKESQAEVGEDVFAALVDLGDLVQVSGEVVFQRIDYERIVAEVRNHFRNEPKLTAAQLRDRLGTSRKYVLAFLEHLDAAGITERVGDERILRKSSINR